MQQPFSNSSKLSTVSCTQKIFITTQTVQELSHGHTHTHTHKQTLLQTIPSLLCCYCTGGTDNVMLSNLIRSIHRTPHVTRQIIYTSICYKASYVNIQLWSNFLHLWWSLNPSNTTHLITVLVLAEANAVPRLPAVEPCYHTREPVNQLMMAMVTMMTIIIDKYIN